MIEKTNITNQNGYKRRRSHLGYMMRPSRLKETFGNLELGLVHRVTEVFETGDLDVTIWEIYIGLETAKMGLSLKLVTQ